MKVLAILVSFLLLSPFQDDMKYVWYHGNGNLKTETHFTSDWLVNSYKELDKDGNIIVDVNYHGVFTDNNYLDIEDPAWEFDKKMGTIPLGETDERLVGRGDVVSVHYICMDKTGKQLDNSFKKNMPLQFVCGGGGVLLSFSKGISKFQYGQFGFMYIPSYQGYGSEQVGNVPPDTDLYYFIQVLPWGV